MDNPRLQNALKWQEYNTLHICVMASNERRQKAKQHRERSKIRRATDPAFRLMCLLRGRLRSALMGKGKSKRTMELCGCSVAQLKAHIEAQWKEGMSWANHGEWEIDHRAPCAIFDLSNPQHQRICFHYTNLQPLWKLENREKRDRYTPADAR